MRPPRRQTAPRAMRRSVRRSTASLTTTSPAPVSLVRSAVCPSLAALPLSDAAKISGVRNHMSELSALVDRNRAHATHAATKATTAAMTDVCASHPSISQKTAHTDVRNTALHPSHVMTRLTATRKMPSVTAKRCVAPRTTHRMNRVARSRASSIVSAATSVPVRSVVNVIVVQRTTAVTSIVARPAPRQAHVAAGRSVVANRRDCCSL